MQRRDFLKRSVPAVALAAVTGSTGFLFHNRDTTKKTNLVAKAADFEVPPDPSLPVLTQATDPDPVSALNASLDAIGGISRFVKSGERVVVKPNIGWDRTPAQGANTHPELVGEMVLPLAVGVVGGVARVHPAVCVNRKISGVVSAAELASLTAAVGLAQNLGALRALAAEGIQSGHMRLHARNVAAEAGAVEGEIDAVAAEIAARATVNVEAARDVLRRLRDAAA
jgi:hydroxymethylglutaryl-CoA reductase